MNGFVCFDPAVEYRNDQDGVGSLRCRTVTINEGRRLCAHRHDHDRIERVGAECRHSRFGLGVAVPILGGTAPDAPFG